MKKKLMWNYSMSTEFKRVAAGLEVSYGLWELAIKVDALFFTLELGCSWG